MSKVKPEVFAKQVLWALAGIQAQLVEIQATVTTLGAKGNFDLIEEVTKESNERRLTKQKDIFAHMAKEAGLNKQQSIPPLDPPASRN